MGVLIAINFLIFYNSDEATWMWFRDLENPLYLRCECAVIHARRILGVFSDFGRGVAIIQQGLAQKLRGHSRYMIFLTSRPPFFGGFFIQNKGHEMSLSTITKNRKRIATIATCWIPFKVYRKYLRGILMMGIKNWRNVKKFEKTAKFENELSIVAIMKNEGALYQGAC